MEALLNGRQAAEVINLSEWMVWQLLKTEQLARVKGGMRVFIEAAELHRFIESNGQ